MKYIKIIGSISKVLGKETGMISGANQLQKTGERMVSYGKIEDEEKFASALVHPDCIIFDTLEELNADMDLEQAEDKYSLSNVDLLKLDLELSGNPEIIGYRADLPLDDQINLKLLHDMNMAGIKKKKKAKHLTE
jgi:hypothetical protein